MLGASAMAMSHAGLNPYSLPDSSAAGASSVFESMDSSSDSSSESSPSESESSEELLSEVLSSEESAVSCLREFWACEIGYGLVDVSHTLSSR
jgi:hypothetical protein